MKESSGFVPFILKDGGYAGYVLLMMLLSYFANQWDRYITQVAEVPFIDYESWEYGLLAGPLFTFFYTGGAILLGSLTKANSRVKFLALSLLFFAAMIALVAATSEFWQVALLRVGLGLGQSVTAPLACTILGDYFTKELHGIALGFFNVGVYSGYGLSLGLGDYLNSLIGWRWSYILAGAFPAVIGILIFLSVKEPSPVEPKDKTDGSDAKKSDGAGFLTICKYWAGRPSLMFLCVAAGVRTGASYCWAAYTSLFFSSMFHEMPLQKQACGYSYNPEYDGSQVCNPQYSYCMAGRCSAMSETPWHDVGLDSLEFDWLISVTILFGGSLGAIIGGSVSDYMAKGRPISYRLLIAIFSSLGCTPFSVGVLLAPYPWCFVCLFITYLVGEMWIGVLYAIVIELVPSKFTATSVAIYLFVRANIGGLVPLLVPFVKEAYSKDHTYTFFASPLIGLNTTSDEALFSVTQQSSIGLQTSLLWLFPGFNALSAIFFAVSFCLLDRDLKARENEEGDEAKTPLLVKDVEKAAEDKPANSNTAQGEVEEEEEARDQIKSISFELEQKDCQQ